VASTLSKLVDVTFRPGLDRSSTPYASEGTWYDSGRVRWRDGYPEAMRGRQTFVVSTHRGTPRTIMSWSQNDGTPNIGMGTESKLYINQGSQYFDVTPVRTSAASSLTLNTVSASREINVCIASHGLTTGDYVIFSSMAATVGGNVFLQGNEYQVSVSTANIFHFQYATSATATSASTGSFNINYLLPSGTSVNTPGIGYGSGTYNTGTYGTQRTDLTIFLRRWSLDNWGEDLLANPSGGRIYWWDRTNGTAVRSVLVTASPSINDVIVVSEEAHHVLSFGCNDEAGVYYPMLMRWSDSDNFNDWVASVGNAAGNLFLTGGNRVVGALRTKGAILSWTDTDLHALDYVGGNFVFRNRKIGDTCGLVGMHAMVNADDTVYWLSHNNFYMYDGNVKILECPLQRDVNSLLNRDQLDKICAFTNSEFGEIGWLIPTSSPENDFAIIHNRYTKAWWWTPLAYSFLHESHLYENIIGGITSTSQLAYHEPVSVYSDDNAPYESFVSSADFDMGEGDDLMFVDRYIPNFIFNGSGQVNMTFTAMRYPNLTGTVKGPYTVDAGTTKIDFRARGRHATIRLACSTLNSYWRGGKQRINVQQDGRR